MGFAKSSTHPAICVRDFAFVIACDKREAFAQGSPCDEAIPSLCFAPLWIASLRSQ
jgi:hypothetical protein